MYICTSSSFACPRHSGARATPGAVGGGNFLLILPGSIFVGSGADDDRDGIEDAFAFLVVELVRDGGRERERERKLSFSPSEERGCSCSPNQVSL